jgi:hypothetical protein
MVAVHLVIYGVYLIQTKGTRLLILVVDPSTAAEDGSSASYGGVIGEPDCAIVGAGGSLKHGGQGAPVHQTRWGK